MGVFAAGRIFRQIQRTLDQLAGRHLSLKVPDGAAGEDELFQFVFRPGQDQLRFFTGQRHGLLGTGGRAVAALDAAAALPDDGTLFLQFQIAHGTQPHAAAAAHTTVIVKCDHKSYHSFTPLEYTMNH